MEYLGTFTAGRYGSFECYKNAEGFIEGYRSTGGTIYYEGFNPVRYGGDIKRIVTNTTTPEAFIEYVKGLRSPAPKTQYMKDQPTLF